MARLRTFAEARSGWVITFADLVMLLLALFVLVFSMSSLDSAIVESISSSVSRDAPQKDLNRGQRIEYIREVAQLMQETGQVHQHEGRIKELLFPRDLLPPAVDKGTLDTSLRVLERDDGVAFVVTSDFLFTGEGSRVSPLGRKLLESLALLYQVSGDAVQISAFYAGPALAGFEDDYAVASRQALAALGVFINQRAAADKLSISSYGADRAAEGLLPGTPLNRVEFLFKMGKASLTEAVE